MQQNFDEFQFSINVKEKLKNKNLLEKELAEGKTVQEIVEFSNETMAKFYQAAYTLFEQKSYSEAADAFLFLATLNSHCAEYWLGLGMATQLNHNYESAIDAYELAAIYDIANPTPYFYLAKCLFAIHDRESALQALNLAIEIAGNAEEYAELKQNAELARKIIIKND